MTSTSFFAVKISTPAALTALYDERVRTNDMPEMLREREIERERAREAVGGREREREGEREGERVVGARITLRIPARIPLEPKNTS